MEASKGAQGLSNDLSTRTSIMNITKMNNQKENISEIMNHFRFASSASVGELIVNFNNPGFFPSF